MLNADSRTLTRLFASLLVFGLAGPLLAGKAKKKTATNATQPKPLAKGMTPARASGGGGEEAPISDVYDAVEDRRFTLKNGEILHVTTDVRHDQTPAAWRDMPDVPAQISEEAPENPPLRPRGTGVPIQDPALQDWIGRKGGNAGLAPAALPTLLFNFAGQGGGGTPPDDNGSIGPTQYVQTINTSVAVYTLNRGTNTAALAAGYPKAVNSLWSGFGGACQTQNSGDPITLYDKAAGRWLIAQFTSTVSGGVYYQCVAISQTSDATGTYNRFAFANPNGYFGDYPHYGVWHDGYYFTVHQFTAPSGGLYKGSGMAALNRAQMLLVPVQPATQQYVTNVTFGGILPADLDGRNAPAPGAPEIFITADMGGLGELNYMKWHTDWVTPANTTVSPPFTLAAAPFNGAGTVAQQGTINVLDTLFDRILFRAAYRNNVNHENILISHGIDPTGAGTVAGTRWYEVRMSGTPNAQCASYPCVYQQGSYAPADGKSRWMGSIAQDAAGNMLLGMSYSGTTQFPSVLLTGRLAGDPLGQMPQGESVVVTGTTSQVGATRWGDYSSMSVDPTDDCTLWFTTEYSGNHSTRIASLKYPSCAACTAPAVATAPTSAISGANQITLNWTAGAGATNYTVYRAVGSCASNPQPQFSIVGRAVAGTSFTDTTVSGGTNYAYKIGAVDATGSCESAVTVCTEKLATGVCNLAPTFAGLSSAVTGPNGTCQATLSWTAATPSNCGAVVGYNIYRSTTAGFTPGAANRIAKGVSGTSYTDLTALANATGYYYIVRSVDILGNEDTNTTTISAKPLGALGPGTFLETFEGPGRIPDNSGWVVNNIVAGAGGPWKVSGAQFHAGAASVFDKDDQSRSDHAYESPALGVAATSVLTFWHTWTLESAVNAACGAGTANFDGCVLEYKRGAGAWTRITGAQITGSTYNGNIDGGTVCTDNPLGTNIPAWVGGTGVFPAFAQATVNIGTIAGAGSTQFRWRQGDDSGNASPAAKGWYVDDIQVTNVTSGVPGVCATCNIIPMTIVTQGKSGTNVTINWPAVAGAANIKVYRATGANPLTWGAAISTVAGAAVTTSDAGQLSNTTSQYYTTTDVANCGAESPQ
jgi:hypothetical protein